MSFSPPGKPTNINKDIGASRDQRQTRRDLVDLPSQLRLGRTSYGAQIINISPRGLMCRTDAVLLSSDQVQIDLPLLAGFSAVIRWTLDGRAGMEFVEPIPRRLYLDMLALMPPRQTGW